MSSAVRLTVAASPAFTWTSFGVNSKDFPFTSTWVAPATVVFDDSWLCSLESSPHPASEPSATTATTRTPTAARRGRSAATVLSELELAGPAGADEVGHSQRDLTHGCTGVRSLDHHAAARVDGDVMDVAVEEHQIARLQSRDRHVRGAAVLRLRGVGESDTTGPPGVHGEA